MDIPIYSQIPNTAMNLDSLWQGRCFDLPWSATDFMNHGVCVCEPLVRWFIQWRNTNIQYILFNK